MPAKGTPWANTLLSAGPIFMHGRSQGKLSQVAGYVIGVAARATGSRRLVFEEKFSCFGARQAGSEQVHPVREKRP
jgi:hypothetical protein